MTDNEAAPKPPPRTKLKPGRKPFDWDGLFAEWLRSGLSRLDFLKTKGMKPTSGHVIRNTSHWEKDLKGAVEKVTDIYVASQASKKHTLIVDNVLAAPEGVPDKIGDLQANAEAERQVVNPAKTSWQKVQDWRSNQVNQDWKTSDNIRLHIGLILKHALVKQKIKDPETGEEKFQWTSNLRPSDIRQLAQASSDVQRIQRLALGLSTDNVGVEMETHVAAPSASDEVKAPTNLFVVELTKGGKFTRARPRRVG